MHQLNELPELCLSSIVLPLECHWFRWPLLLSVCWKCGYSRRFRYWENDSFIDRNALLTSENDKPSMQILKPEEDEEIVQSKVFSKILAEPQWKNLSLLEELKSALILICKAFSTINKHFKIFSFYFVYWKAVYCVLSKVLINNTYPQRPKRSRNFQSDCAASESLK